MEEESIRVCIRVRPESSRELNLKKSINVESSTEISIETKSEQKTLFTFDFIAKETSTQVELFNEIGRPITEACLKGFNGTVICYGMTGTGKSYTTFGNDLEKDSFNSDGRGLVPRVLEYIYQHMEIEKNKSPNLSYSSKCVFYEIYQERVFDLLDNSNSGSSLQVREDSKRGVFVDGITEELILSPEGARNVLMNGYRNRHVGQTDMNRESSRSHAIFVLSLQFMEQQPNGATKSRSSRFSFVDLAGSERQGQTNASGDRLKEAGVINKSLSTLGNVINALSDKRAASSSRTRHVNYRDSKLTFLLRDSLGGNTKTVLVATLSPSSSCFEESLSTLKFAQRAKNIRNVVVLNEETSGTMEALQSEIDGLKRQLYEVLQSKALTALPNVSNPLAVESASGAAIEVASASLLSPVSSFNLDELKRSETRALIAARARCRIADELRIRSDNNNAALAKRLEQMDKVLMGLKMQLKMRDSEIHRLKKTSIPAPTEGVANPSLEELVQIEVAAIKEEAQAETLKFKLAFEELERRVRETTPQSTSTDASVSPLPTASVLSSTLWSREQESSFQHQLEDYLSKLEEANEIVAEKFNFLADARFNDLFGFSVEEGLALLRERDECKIAMEASERDTRNANLQANEARKQLIAVDATCKRQLAEMEKDTSTAIESLQKSLASAQTECSLKTDALENLQTQMQAKIAEIEKSAAAASKLHKEKESQSRSSYNTAMKDNIVLLQRCREIESELVQVSDDFSAAGVRISNLEEQLRLAAETDEALRTTISQAELYAFEQTEALRVVSSERDLVSNSLKISREETARFRDKLQSLVSTKEELQLRINDLLGQQEVHLREITHMVENEATSRVRFAEQQRLYEVLASEADDLKTLLSQREQNYLESMAALEASLSSVTQAHEVAMETVHQLQADIKLSDIEKSDLQTCLTESEEAIKSLRIALAESESDRTSAKEIISQLEASHDVLQKTLELSTARVSTLEINILEQIEAGVVMKDTKDAEIGTFLRDLRVSQSKNEELLINLRSSESSLSENKEALSALEEQREVLQAKLADAKTLQDRLAVELAMTKSNVDAKEKAVEEVYVEVAKLVDERSSLVSMLKDRELRISVLSSERSSLAEAQEIANKSLEICTVELQEAQSLLEERDVEYKERLEKSSVEYSTLENAHQQLQENAFRAESELQRLLDAALGTQSALMTSLETARASVAQSGIELSALRGREDELGDIVVVFEKKLSTLEKEAADTNKTLTAIKASNVTYKADFANAEAKVLELNDAISLSVKRHDFLRIEKEEISAKLVVETAKYAAHVKCLEAAVAANTKAAEECDALRLKLSQAETEAAELIGQLKELHEENNRLCGHNNNKQKIQQHQQLKKELLDQYDTIKQQRSEIVELTLERDAAQKELLRAKMASADHFENTALASVGGKGSSSLLDSKAILSKAANTVKRYALRDRSNKPTHQDHVLNSSI